MRNYVLPAALLVIGPECRMKDKTANIVDLLLTIADRISFNLIDISKPNI